MTLTSSWLLRWIRAWNSSCILGEHREHATPNYLLTPCLTQTIWHKCLSQKPNFAHQKADSSYLPSWMDGRTACCSVQFSSLHQGLHWLSSHLRGRNRRHAQTFWKQPLELARVTRGHTESRQPGMLLSSQWLHQQWLCCWILGKSQEPLI